LGEKVSFRGNQTKKNQRDKTRIKREGVMTGGDKWFQTRPSAIEHVEREWKDTPKKKKKTTGKSTGKGTDSRCRGFKNLPKQRGEDCINDIKGWKTAREDKQKGEIGGCIRVMKMPVRRFKWRRGPALQRRWGKLRGGTREERTGLIYDGLKNW